MGSLGAVVYGGGGSTRGECGGVTEELASTMFIESDLFLADPIADWQQQQQQQQSIFDSKDWGSINSQAQDHHLYIDPCCDFGDVFGGNGLQTTPISVLDYVHEQQQQHYHSSDFDSGFFERDQDDAMEIQELLAGFTQQGHGMIQLPKRAPGELEIERLAGELAGEIDSSSSSAASPPGQMSSSSLPPLTPVSARAQVPQQGISLPVANPRLSSVSQGSCFNPRTPPPHPRTPQLSPGSTTTSVCVQSEQRAFINPKLEELDYHHHRHHHPQEHHQEHQQLVIQPMKQEMVALGGGGVSRAGGGDYNSNHHHHLGQQQQQQQQQRHHSNNFPKFEPVDQQLRLVRMLLSCAGAVAIDNLDLARAILVQLRALVVPHGSPMQRLASYVTEALVARLSRNTRSSHFQGLIADHSLQQLSSATRSDMLEAFWVFYEYIPIGKFTHLTMNQILLEAADRERAIHVVDFQVWYGAQWPSFLQSLAMRPGGPPVVRMTAVGSSLRDLQEAGSKLLDCARSLGVPFEYCILRVELEEFHAGMVELRDGEAVLVNSLCQFHRFLKRDLDQFLQGLRSLRPRLVVMAENDADHNSPDFMHRFMACLHYYSAVFDAFDASLHMPGTLPGRKKLEELIAAQKLRNMIACEGSERVERHESMRAWNARMEGVGFRAVSMSHKAINQASLLLKLYYSDGYTLTNQEGFLILGWRGMPLNGVGAWI
ncbi:DELLA protein RGL2 [Selaginella moellendorffii]|nr:DELLA protein RGL2 [Selaginella moellendorffii]|eukprot:XP_002977541.2 DELLA protein RGL2 [Selaginella moellendorffii]